jgi:hypothetical protein
METIPQVATAMQTILGHDATLAGRQTGFVQRASKIDGSVFTQTLVFGLLAQPHATLENLTQTAAALGVTVSPQGLEQRFTRAAALCLEQVLTATMRTVIHADPVAIPLLKRFTGVYLQDSSTIVLPPSLAEVWSGCGDATGAATAALKIQIQVDLLGGQLHGQLQDGRESDHTRSLDYHVPAGAVRIADLGYWDVERFAALDQRGVYWFSRGHATTAIQGTDARWWTLDAFLNTHGDAATIDVPIRVGKTAQLPARLLAIRVPQEVADQRRRRLRADARAKGKMVSATRLCLAAWTVFVTNIPPERLCVAEAVVFGRARWQIELIFKLWKSHGDVDTLRSVQCWRILCEVYAKLIGQIMQHWVVLVSCWADAARSLTKAAQTIRLHVLSLAQAVHHHACLIEEITHIAQCIAAGCRMNQRKHQPNTYQLLLESTAERLG